MDSILFFSRAIEEILPHAIDYTTPYLLCIPFTITETAVYYYTHAVENPFVSAVTYIAPALIAMFLEYIFLLQLDFGMEGPAFL